VSGLWLDPGVASAEVLAVEGEARLLPQSADDPGCLAESGDLLAGGAPGQAEGLELAVVAARPETEDQPAAGKAVKGSAIFAVTAGAR
jgi:hypothetical protein